VSEEKPHSVIFNEFKERIGINKDYETKATVASTSLCWRDAFKEICKSQNVCVGLGAIGLGTEMIVPKIYDHFIHAIEDHSSFENCNSMFFRLHVDCDDGHSEDLLTVIRDFADTSNNREYLRFGAQIALDLRKNFWDVMLSRALKMNSTNKIPTAA
jgi:pyrroloquinoline quinone (PQQ) biosynthesis protein C